MATDLFCRDCKHMRGEGVKSTCESPRNFIEHVAVEKYLVTGEEQPVIKAMRGASCTALRIQRAAEIDATVCGPSGKWFERKEG